MFSRNEIIIWIFVAIIGITLAYSCRLEAGEWNEKPVMCADEKETFEAVFRKKEKLLFTGLEFAKVITETGYARTPAKLPFRIFANLETGTYTIIEYHPEYTSYCIIAYGVNLQSFMGGMQ